MGAEDADDEDDDDDNVMVVVFVGKTLLLLFLDICFLMFLLLRDRMNWSFLLGVFGSLSLPLLVLLWFLLLLLPLQILAAVLLLN